MSMLILNISKYIHLSSDYRAIIQKKTTINIRILNNQVPVFKLTKGSFF